jgi:hypothetical protein
MTLAIVLSAATAAAEEVPPIVTTADAPSAQYVLVHDGRSIWVVPVGAAASGLLSTGRTNCAARGYAILAEADGSLLVVRYSTTAAGEVTYVVRHVDPDGRVDWTRELSPTSGEVATGDVATRIAFAVPR